MTVAGIFFCVANIIAFLAFVLDKLFAKWERRRIPEYVLLLLGLCGGATGGYIAMLLFRHSMMPDLYPIPYLGTLDFTKDGVIDISDAMILFRYSMMPDLYPIG